MDVTGVTKMTAQELDQHRQQGRALTLIHVLPREVFEARRIPGSVNACVYEVTFPEQIAAVAPRQDAPVLVYGAGEALLDAPMAAEKLTRMGYQDVAMLVGGMDAWRDAGLPLEGTRADRPDMQEGVFEPSDGVFALQPEESMLEWTGRNANGRHVGAAQVVHGRLNILDGAMDGRFEVDMSTIENKDLVGDEALRQTLHAHLASDDFFFTQLFPKAEYMLDSAVMTDGAAPGSPNYEWHGKLQLRGVTRPLSFPTTIRPAPGDSEMGVGPGVSIEAHFDLDRTQWGAVYGSGRLFRHLSWHLVYDLVSFQMRLVVR